MTEGLEEARRCESPVGRRQGDIVPQLKQIPVLDGVGEVSSHPCDHGVAVVSQTCDIAHSKTDMVQVCPLVELPKDKAKEALEGHTPRLVFVHDQGPLFADLDIVATVHMACLENAGWHPSCASSTPEGQRKFARAVARKASRAALPDDVVPFVNPLRMKAKKKSLKEASPWYPVFKDVAEIWVGAPNGWARWRDDFVMVFALKKGVLLPEDDLDNYADSGMPSNIESDSPGKRLDWIVQQFQGAVSVERRRALWPSLASAIQEWLIDCSTDVRVDLLVEIQPEDEITAFELRTRERLDLSYLSPVAD